MTNTPVYQAVKETAMAWGVSKRYVNMCVAEGRIPGAVKVGNIWLIPSGAQRPAAKHLSRNAHPNASTPIIFPEGLSSSDLTALLTVILTPSPLDHPDSVLEAASEERLRLIRQGAFAYARGDFEQAKRCYMLGRGDAAASLCASSIAIAAAISTGDYPCFLEIESDLQRVIQGGGTGQSNASPEASSFAELTLASAHLGAMAPQMVPAWIKEGDFSTLPSLLRQEAAYRRAKYYQCVGKFEAMLAVAETGLALGDPRPGLSFTDAYLRLMCAVACFALDRSEEAKRWLLGAMRRNLPHGFITPFVELMPVLGGMVEQCLKKEFPALYDASMAQWKRTFPGWVTFHNRFTKEHITLLLTLREYEIARLVARRVPYAKAAEQLNLSMGSLKNAMQVIYGKLYVNSREELSKLIL